MSGGRRISERLILLYCSAKEERRMNSGELPNFPHKTCVFLTTFKCTSFFEIFMYFRLNFVRNCLRNIIFKIFPVNSVFVGRNLATSEGPYKRSLLAWQNKTFTASSWRAFWNLGIILAQNQRHRRFSCNEISGFADSRYRGIIGGKL